MKLAKAVEEVTWGVTVKATRFQNELCAVHDRIFALEHFVESSKAVEKRRWGIAEKIGWLQNELYIA